LLNYFVLGCYIAAVSALLSGLIVSFGDRKKALNRIYFLFSMAIFLWSASLGSAVIAPNPETSLFLFRLEHVGVVFIPTVYLHMVLILVGLQQKYKKIIYIMYVSSAVLFGLNFTRLIVKSVSPKFYFPYYKNPGTAYPLLFFLFAVGVFYALHLLFTTYRKLSGYQRNRLKLFFGASIVGYIGGLPAFLPLYNVNPSPFPIYLTPAFYFIFAYAIVKYRLIDVHEAISRGAMYVITILLGILPTAIIVFVLQKVYPLTIPITLVFIIAVFLALMFNKIHPFSERFVQRRLFKTQLNYYQILQKFSQDMVSALDLKSLLERFDKTLRESMQVTSVAIYLTGPMNGKYPLTHASDVSGDIIPILRNKDKEGIDEAVTIEGIGLAASHHSSMIPLWKSGDALVAMAYQAEDVLVLGEMEMMAREKDNRRLEEAIAQMKEAKAEVCLPLKRDGKMVGIALLGPREGDRYYSPDDLSLLHTLAQNACVAVQNALMVEEIKRSYQMLQRVERLTAMGSLIAGVSHEIRNPLMPISFLMETIADPTEDKKLVMRLHKYSKESLRRITNVLDEMDEFARPYTPALQKININRIMDDALRLLDKQLTAQKQEVITEYSELPEAMFDSGRLKQALADILLNAIEANPKGGKIHVRTRQIQLKKTRSQSARTGIQIEIADSGCGIAERDIEKVFDPFFTTKHKSMMREGTGLGLALAHRIVEEHHGSIELRSAVGKGTTVFINLPVGI